MLIHWCFVAISIIGYQLCTHSDNFDLLTGNKDNESLGQMDRGVRCGCQCGVDRECDTSLVDALTQLTIKQQA